MALLLNIDTAIEVATISIADNNTVIVSVTNNNQKDHASFLQPAIKDLLQKTHLSISRLKAISVTVGPGSYTGIRVGMASAKGLCYALNLPLIAINTLEVLALSSMNTSREKTGLFCPMIDARRMEVFTAVYNHDLKEIVKPCSLILENDVFKDLLQENKICFSGSGATKLKTILDDKNAEYVDSDSTAAAMAELSYKHFHEKIFANVATISPLYLKEFYTIKK